jgi:hypothetical protein
VRFCLAWSRFGLISPSYCGMLDDFVTRQTQDDGVVLW